MKERDLMIALPPLAEQMLDDHLDRLIATHGAAFAGAAGALIGFAFVASSIVGELPADVRESAKQCLAKTGQGLTITFAGLIECEEVALASAVAACVFSLGALTKAASQSKP